jgi:hypothetical protein
LSKKPNAEWVVDLYEPDGNLPTGSFLLFTVDPFARTCLLQGVDELGYILSSTRKSPRLKQALILAQKKMSTAIRGNDGQLTISNLRHHPARWNAAQRCFAFAGR